jgi:hypothetical protein
MSVIRNTRGRNALMLIADLRGVVEAPPTPYAELL